MFNLSKSNELKKVLSIIKLRCKTCFLLFLIFHSLFFIPTTRAQNFNGGLLVGLTASEISGDQNAGPNKPGPLLGAFINHPLENDAFLQLEMYYVQKGSRKNPNPDMGDYNKYVLRINYIEMPILYIFKKFKIFTPELGLAPAVHFGDSERDEYGIMTRPADTPQFKPYDISIIGGSSFKLSDKLRFDFRYSTSLFAVRQHNGGAMTYFNKGQYSSVWYLSLRYLFKAKETE